MSSVQSSGGRQEEGAPLPHAQFVQALGSGMAGRLLPVLAATLEAEREVLVQSMRGESPPPDGPEDIANLNIISAEITVYERRWRARFGHALKTWPVPPAAALHHAFSLVSDDELQGQLIGQPVVEALGRRHADILDTIDKRLWSLAAAMGGEVRPVNPFSPRHVVESFLQTFTPADCGPRLRGALLRHCERLAGERLVDAYSWCNRQLSEAGIALAGASDFATLAATTVAGSGGRVGVAKLEVWGSDNALDPTRASWRVSRVDGSRLQPDALRGAMLRHAARARRGSGEGGRGDGMRDLRAEEFMAVLSLLQGESAPLQAREAGYARAMRAGLSQVAGSLGIDSASAAPSAGQEDALDVVGGLFDHLAGNHHLLEDARNRLASLAPPILRLALEDTSLFERPLQPPMQLLSLLVGLWDANPGAPEHDARLHELADTAAQQVVDEFHGDPALFARVLEQLERELERLRQRASISERRAWQAIEGGERLDAARLAADRELASRLGDQPLLAAVGTFLQDQWRQSLVQAWLRDGPGSDRFAEVLVLADTVVALDADAARAEGVRVASRLVDLQPQIQACHVACGLDAQAAERSMAELVAAFANPDAPRRIHDFTSLSKSMEGGAEDPAALDPDGPGPGHVLIQREDGQPVRALRLAWRSPLSGASLLVNSRGTRELLLRPAELAAMLADGRLQPRPSEGPVEAALQRLERDLLPPAPA